MAFSIESNKPDRAGRPRLRQAIFPVTVILATLAFLAAPWPTAVKAHALLHGLCAQRPSHTFRFGGQALPFDARMTGIYAGFLLSAIVLAAQGKFRAAKLPRVWIMGVLALMLGAMALDGFNSLFIDLQAPHLYLPSNVFRLATGAGVGIVLAIALSYLIAITLWQRPSMTETAVDGRGLLILIGAQLPLIVFLTGWGPLYQPLTLLLLCSALCVFSILATVTLVMALRRDNEFAGPRDVQAHAAIGLALGVAAMAALAGVRFLYERHFGPSPMT